MNIITVWLNRRFSEKPGFWFFQIIGWLSFMLMDFFTSYKEIISLKCQYFWVLSFFTGFSITLILRYWLKRFFTSKLSKINIYAIAITILTSSIIAAALWATMRVIIINPFDKVINENSHLAIKIPSAYYYLRIILNYAWPLMIWCTLYFGIKFWINLIEANELSQKASLLAQKSQLQMLRYQLNPHFLFNSLNSIQALVYDDPKHADKMITELSDFLRFTLHDKDKIFIPLGEEVKIVEKYLSMEKTRFPDRLEYAIEVSEQASKIEVIAFILQPFVENAIKHGMKSSSEKVVVTVRGYTEAKRLYIEVINSGIWIDSPDNMGTGIKNVYERLQNAYPEKYNIHIYKHPKSVNVLIEISV